LLSHTSPVEHRIPPPPHVPSWLIDILRVAASTENKDDTHSED